MERFSEITRFFEYDYAENFFIEPEVRSQRLIENLNDLISTCKPASIVKAGIGSGKVLDSLIEKDALISIVEPSCKLILDYTRTRKDKINFDKVKFINGSFNQFPIDYYKAEMLISIDALDIIDSATAIDEFRRTLQFEGILFLACVVLNDDDIEGVYDDMIHSVFPLHNDYYLKEDLKTVMNLNEFDYIKGATMTYGNDLDVLAAKISAFTGQKCGFQPFLEEFSRVFTELYKLQGTKFDEPYFIGVFKKRKYIPSK
jgi:ubiquinone/menaquinone biosynthesis C-methylase UbiE